jgi:hypothetical protein
MVVMPYLYCMATVTTTHEITTMKIVTRIYLDDNGRCTCEQHAGESLAASIAANPFAHIHTTTIGTWERMTTDDIRLFGADISCDRC